MRTPIRYTWNSFYKNEFIYFRVKDTKLVSTYVILLLNLDNLNIVPITWNIDNIHRLNNINEMERERDVYRLGIVQI